MGSALYINREWTDEVAISCITKCSRQYSEFQLTWNIQLGQKKSKIVLK